MIDPLNVDLGLASSKNTLRAPDLNPKSRQKTLRTPLFRHHDNSRFRVCSPSSLNLPSLKTSSPKSLWRSQNQKSQNFPLFYFCISVGCWWYRVFVFVFSVIRVGVLIYESQEGDQGSSRGGLRCQKVSGL